MQLGMPGDSIESAESGNLRRLLVHVNTPTSVTSVSDCYLPVKSKNDYDFVSILCPCYHWGGPFINLLKLSLIFARKAQSNGGFLIHGALAECDGKGVILTAPGGTGKTTASNRLPSPWRSLCDDTTLVVRDPQGTYWAHPWPTWSRFYENGPGGSWDVQKAIPLKGIFFLSRALEDRVESAGSGESVSLLMEGMKQASMSMEQGLSKKEVSFMYLERFNNICAFSKVIPLHILHISLTGSFWKEIEKVL